MARGNLQVELSSGAFLRRLHMQNFHQPELIPAVAVAEFYRIHALSYKVQAQAARPYIFERAPAHLFRIHRCTTIFQHDLKGIVASAIPGHMDPAEGGLDGLLWVSKVCMPNDICQRFVDGKNNGAALRLGKSHGSGELSQSVSYHAEHLGVALELHSE